MNLNIKVKILMEYNILNFNTELMVLGYKANLLDLLFIVIDSVSDTHEALYDSIFSVWNEKKKAEISYDNFCKEVEYLFLKYKNNLRKIISDRDIQNLLKNGYSPLEIQAFNDQNILLTFIKLHY